MKKEYWDVSNQQVIEKTGRPISDWMTVLDEYMAGTKKSSDVVSYLQTQHAVPRYWARTLTTHYLKRES